MGDEISKQQRFTQELVNQGCHITRRVSCFFNSREFVPGRSVVGTIGASTCASLCITVRAPFVCIYQMWITWTPLLRTHCAPAVSDGHASASATDITLNNALLMPECMTTRAQRTILTNTSAHTHKAPRGQLSRNPSNTQADKPPSDTARLWTRPALSVRTRAASEPAVVIERCEICVLHAATAHAHSLHQGTIS